MFVLTVGAVAFGCDMLSMLLLPIESLQTELWEALATAVITSVALSSVGLPLLARIQRRAFDAEKAIDSTDDGYWVLDSLGNFLDVNDAYCRMMGYERARLMTLSIADLESVATQAQIQQQIARIVAKGQERFETRHRHYHGHWVDLEITVTAINAHRLVAFLRDITRRKGSERRIQELAYFDSLTGLPNRHSLRDRIGQALLRSETTRYFGALLFVDLDNFKLINDTSGHAEGDRMLVEMAKRLGRSVREGDTVARMGGDEFVILMESLSHEPDMAGQLAWAIGEQCRLSLDEIFTLGDIEFRASASFGLALFQGAGLSSGELLKRADTAMYQAKATGRNRVVLFEQQMQQALTLRAQLEADLRRALHEQQLQLYYQPQVDARHRVTGAEVLLRWQHPERGLVRPLDFIPIAEESGLILPIGAWVLESACRQLEVWQGHAATRDLQLAVNVSVQQFSHPDFVEDLTALLARHRFSPDLLKLELTESLVIRQLETVIARMHAIRALGVLLSMDDFGTGQASLASLRRIPIHQLKIDQAFVRELSDQPQDVAITAAIITLGETLGLEVIAEGVETEAQRGILESIGCHRYQGYLFSPPVPLAQYQSLVFAAAGLDMEAAGTLEWVGRRDSYSGNTHASQA